MNNSITRRNFLRASGVCLALPWLESLANAVPATTPPKRAVFVGTCTHRAAF
jgi:hypothetical protein